MSIPPLNLNWPGTWLVAALLLALLLVPLWLILRRRGQGRGRQTVRLVLHGLLWLALVGLWLQPRWQQPLPAKTLLLVADNVPGALARQVATRHKKAFRLSVAAFQRLKITPPVDSVWLVGQSFPPNVLARLSGQSVGWEPYDAHGEVQQIRWEGVVRQGDNQVVQGQIGLETPQWLRLRFGQKTLDSTRLAPGNQPFRLIYPVFSRGRTALTLWLDQTLLDTLRFVARPIPPLRVRFVVDAPDFETQTLARWLGQQGHAVTLLNRLSTGISSEQVLNPGTLAAPPDLVITDAANLNNKLIGKMLADGKSVFVLNLTPPDLTFQAIGRATNTQWAVRRVPGKDTLRVGELAAWPVQFLPTIRAFLLPNYPVAVQPAPGGGRVGVSLLTETYPLRLRGDSVAYARLWLSVLAQLRPSAPNNLLVDAPIFRAEPTRFRLNNARPPVARLLVGADTATFSFDPINPRAHHAITRPTTIGWTPVQDSLAIYVSNNQATKPLGALAAVGQRRQTAAWVRLHRQYDTGQIGATVTPKTLDKSLPDWGWLLLVGLLLTAVWVEPKLG